MYAPFVFIFVLASSPLIFSSQSDDEIFSLETCNIPEIDAYITQDEFHSRYIGENYRLSQPVVFRQISISKQFREMIKLDSILHRYGNKYITVTTANSYSYQKQSMRLNNYIHLQRKASKTKSKWGK